MEVSRGFEEAARGNPRYVWKEMLMGGPCCWGPQEWSHSNVSPWETEGAFSSLQMSWDSGRQAMWFMMANKDVAQVALLWNGWHATARGMEASRRAGLAGERKEILQHMSSLLPLLQCAQPSGPSVVWEVKAIYSLLLPVSPVRAHRSYVPIAPHGGAHVGPMEPWLFMKSDHAVSVCDGDFPE